MKNKLIILTAFVLISTARVAHAQLINPNFEIWSQDILVPTAMNPNSGNNTTGWWDYNYFNSIYAGSSPISVTRCTDTVHTGNYSVRLETKVYTPTSWNIYKYWGIPFIGHEYNDTLGILFNGKANLTNQTFIPGIPCNQNLTQFKFYYQYKPNGNDTAECRVELLSSGTPVAGGSFKTNAATGNSGWQQAVIDFTYINGLIPDTMYILFSSSSLDAKPKAGSALWIDDASVTLPTGITQAISRENDFEIFPNPTSGIFSIRQKVDNSELQTIEIYNLLGKNLQVITNNQQATFDIDISNLSKGIYFVKFNYGIQSNIEKIVVQ